MQKCAVCDHPVAPEAPYCSSCDHDRIVESLQAPMKRPPWFGRAVMAGAALVGAWFLITVGVAFLREAQALRWARTALGENKAPRAYGLVSPFVKSHPSHAEALYLAGQAAIKFGKPQEAAAYYSRLRAISKDKATERAGLLEGIYDTHILASAVNLACGQRPYEAFYATYTTFGEEFHDTLLESAARVARKCVVEGNRYTANEPGFWLIHEKELEPELVVTALYIKPLAATLERREYYRAQQLALHGVELWPDAKPQVDAIFGQIRTQVAETVGAMEELCTRVGRDPEFRQGRSACFPATTPSAVVDQKDTWGTQLVYTPLALQKRTQCHRGFQLISLGADGHRTPNDRHATPAMEITCDYQWGRPRLTRPNRFWWPQS